MRGRERPEDRLGAPCGPGAVQPCRRVWPCPGDRRLDRPASACRLTGVTRPRLITGHRGLLHRHRGPSSAHNGDSLVRLSTTATRALPQAETTALVAATIGVWRAATARAEGLFGQAPHGWKYMMILFPVSDVAVGHRACWNRWRGRSRRQRVNRSLMRDDCHSDARSVGG